MKGSGLKFGVDGQVSTLVQVEKKSLRGKLYKQSITLCLRLKITIHIGEFKETHEVI